RGARCGILLPPPRVAPMGFHLKQHFVEQRGNPDCPWVVPGNSMRLYPTSPPWRFSMAMTTLGVKVDESVRDRLRIASERTGFTAHALHKQALLSYLARIEKGELPAELHP